jgi:ABC-type amino acid transport substrate-binding protein
VRKARFWLATLVAVFALVVASCAGDEEGGGETEATGATAETGTTGATATGATGPSIPTFTTLTEGVLQVGSCLDYAPFESIKGGDEVGFDVDMVEEIASRLGLQVEWLTASFDTIFTAVAGGQFDMVAAASTITEEREQTVDFSAPYFNSRQALVVNTELTPDLSAYDQLQAGDVVGVQRDDRRRLGEGQSGAQRDRAPDVHLGDRRAPGAGGRCDDRVHRR